MPRPMPRPTLVTDCDCGKEVLAVADGLIDVTEAEESDVTADEVTAAADAIATDVKEEARGAVEVGIGLAIDDDAEPPIEGTSLLM